MTPRPFRKGSVASLHSSCLQEKIRNIFKGCWSNSFENKEWIFDAPNLACLFVWNTFFNERVNLIFLCDILRILLTQLQSHPNEPSNFRFPFEFLRKTSVSLVAIQN
ncbi:hypothetical protein KUTeg_008934 [Tegillarca granosa]|uniref:Uncharacterized protein n=1 Tax=Tegillarca granosa TaxID=220873 RepID=A0ABQ9FAH1_TEGGR|nr:hypothetical protein KUTeg_008934 [Tegillarca granosa]